MTPEERAAKAAYEVMISLLDSADAERARRYAAEHGLNDMLGAWENLQPKVRAGWIACILAAIVEMNRCLPIHCPGCGIELWYMSKVDDPTDFGISPTREP